MSTHMIPVPIGVSQTGVVSNGSPAVVAAAPVPSSVAFNQAPQIPTNGTAPTPASATSANNNPPVAVQNSTATPVPAVQAAQHQTVTYATSQNGTNAQANSVTTPATVAVPPAQAAPAALQLDEKKFLMKIGVF